MTAELAHIEKDLKRKQEVVSKYQLLSEKKQVMKNRIEVAQNLKGKAIRLSPLLKQMQKSMMPDTILIYIHWLKENEVIINGGSKKAEAVVNLTKFFEEDKFAPQSEIRFLQRTNNNGYVYQMHFLWPDRKGQL